MGCSSFQILGTILKVDEGGTKKMDPRTRKLMIMHKALHPKDDVDRLYWIRKE